MDSRHAAVLRLWRRWRERASPRPALVGKKQGAHAVTDPSSCLHTVIPFGAERQSSRALSG